MKSISRPLLGITTVVALVSSGLMATFAVARGAGEVQVELKAFKVVRRNQNETFTPAAKIKPGEIIEYRVEYSNRTNHAVKGLQATLPIPTGLRYLSGTAVPGKVAASLDGKTFAAAPLMRQVKLPNGENKTVPVPVAEYRFLRWTLGELSAGKSTTVKARVTLQGS